MSQSQQSFSTGALTDDMGRPVPELVLPFVALGGVLALAWVWRRSRRAQA